MTDLPNLQVLKEALVDTLEADTDLMAYIAAVANSIPPAYVAGLPYDWTDPCLVYFVSSNVDSIRNAYGERGRTIEITIVAHDRGPMPGALDYARCYETLRLADAALAALPATINDWHTVRFREVRDVPEFALEDPGLFFRHQVGAIYEWWIV